MLLELNYTKISSNGDEVTLENGPAEATFMCCHQSFSAEAALPVIVLLI